MPVIEAENPPLWFLVGPTAIRLVSERLQTELAEIDRREALSQVDGSG